MATLPTRITWASPAALEPLGFSASSADREGSGSLVPSVNSSGALKGAAIRAEAATATRQSVASTSVTAPGLRAGSGNTARAIAAAVWVGSVAGTRVVFFVAVSGKPRFCLIWLGGASRPGCEGSSERTSRPQPATTSAARSTMATRRIGGTLVGMRRISRRLVRATRSAGVTGDAFAG